LGVFVGDEIVKKSFKTALLSLAFVTSLGATAQAATVTATSVDQYTQGSGVVASRAVTSNALGDADGSFLSLGLGGSAIFSFGTLFNPIGSIVEITFGNPNNYKESADLFGILSGVATFLGNISNTNSTSFSFAGVFDQLLVKDTSQAVAGRDGFDIDSISVTPASVPLPASGLLLIPALGAIALRRRRKA
jgi:hypothetical protein